METNHSTTEVFSAENETSHSDYARLAAGEFISSTIQKPPFQKVVEVYNVFGGTNKVMYHESENDGYDFANEKPMVVHLIYDFSTAIQWRHLDWFACR